MKKLIALLLLSPWAYADMDKICYVDADKTTTVGEQIREQNCERNNILNIKLEKIIDRH